MSLLHRKYVKEKEGVPSVFPARLFLGRVGLRRLKKNGEKYEPVE